MFGTLITAPIINQPQVAILSTDGVKKKPVVIESDAGDSIAIRPVGVLAQNVPRPSLHWATGAIRLAFLRRSADRARNTRLDAGAECTHESAGYEGRVLP